MRSLDSARPQLLRLALLLPLAPVLSGCLGSSQARTRDVIWLVQHGRFEEAHEKAQERLREDPSDEEVRALARDAEVALLLDRGRRAVFAGYPEQGLNAFLEALQVDPGNEYARKWILKTRVQLAEEDLDEVIEIGVGGDLDRAEDLCERVLFYLPAEDLDERIKLLRAQAKDMLQRVLITKNYRITKSRSYYDDGIESLAQFLLPGAVREFTVSGKYDPDFDEAGTKLTDVERTLAEERLAIAQGMEEEGYWSAARNEYRMVLLIDEDNAEAREGLDRMDLEVRARHTLKEAEMDLLRGDLERAQEHLEDAGELTEGQGDQVGLLAGQVEDARYREMYDRAVGLEKQGRYPEAVEAFSELLGETEFYEDAISRRKTLGDFIDLAEKLYADVLATEDVDSQRALLAQIQVFWPEYLDVEQRLEELGPAPEEKPPAEESGEEESGEEAGEDDPDGGDA